MRSQNYWILWFLQLIIQWNNSVLFCSLVEQIKKIRSSISSVNETPMARQTPIEDYCAFLNYFFFQRNIFLVCLSFFEFQFNFLPRLFFNNNINAFTYYLTEFFFFSCVFVSLNKFRCPNVFLIFTKVTLCRFGTNVQWNNRYYYTDWQLAAII